MNKMKEGATQVATMRRVFGCLISSLGYANGNKVFNGYCKEYGLKMDDPAPDAVIVEVFTKYARF